MRASGGLVLVLATLIFMVLLFAAAAGETVASLLEVLGEWT